ncbi:MAG: glycosyltransferase [Coriobacteriia bacterium]|nr:glycosyltransferase [Coriobacteriia bacterium]
MPSSQPLISILIPIYNVQDYLDECLKSAADQTFTDIEVICINDGSTDGSRDIIERYVQSDPRFRLIDKANSGYGASMNRGLDEAQGQYIAILESDDIYEVDKLAKLYQRMQDFDAEVVKANCFLYWSGPPSKNTFCHLVPQNQYNRLVDPQVNHEIFYLQPSVWSALYRRDFLQKNDIRFLETPGASYQDTAFSFKVWYNATRVVYIEEALIHYRQDNMSSSVRSAAKVYCVVDEYAEIDRYLATRPIPDWLPGLKTKMKYNTYLWNYERLADEFQLEFLEHMSKELNDDQQNNQLDIGLFEEWNRYDLRSILDDPQAYHQRRMESGNRGKFGKALHYLKTGGPVLLLKVVKSKLFPEY